MKFHPKFIAFATAILTGCQAAEILETVSPSNCAVSFTVLGTGQDGGAPQIGRHDDPAWTDRSTKLMAASGVLVNHVTGRRYLFEATPDIREQLYILDKLHGPAENDDPLGLSGVFLTHAHIGHYAGLMMFGHEAAGTKNLPVFAMPRMMSYLQNNGPWSQLVDFENITLKSLSDKGAEALEGAITVTPYRVPHRDEFSETVGYVIQSEQKSLLFLPDIDDWNEWREEFGVSVEDMIRSVDYAYLDATFFDDNELPGRDMSQIPHPRMLDSAKRFSDMSTKDKAKIRFFHMNHTNPARFPNSKQAKQIRDMGYRIAKQGESVCLEAAPSK